MLFRENGRTMRRLKKLRYALSRPATAVNAGVVIPLDSPAISPELKRAIYLEPYEPNEIAIVGATLAPEDVVLELGAGIGFVSTFCARRIGSDRVFAYEANPALEAVIRATYAANQVSPSLQICVLGHTAGECEFYVDGQFISSSLIRRNETARPVRVPMRDINAEFRRIKPTFLICDIEGAEIEVFASLDLTGVNKILIELHPHIVASEALSDLVATVFRAGFYLDFSLSRKNVHFFRRRSPKCPEA